MRRALAGVLLVAVAAGCGGPPPVRLRPPARLPQLPPPVLPATSASLEQAVQRLSNARATDEAARALDDLGQQDDPWGSAFRAAICAGMDQLAESSDEQATGDGWRNFLEGVVENLVSGALKPLVLEKVDGALTTWDLTQVNAGAARVYAEACVMPRN